MINPTPVCGGALYFHVLTLLPPSDMLLLWLQLWLVIIKHTKKPYKVKRCYLNLCLVNVISVKGSFGRPKSPWTGLMLMGSIPAGRRCVLHHDAGRSLSASQKLSPTVYKAVSHWTTPLFTVHYCAVFWRGWPLFNFIALELQKSTFQGS